MTGYYHASGSFKWIGLFILLFFTNQLAAAPVFVGKDLPYQLYIDPLHKLDFAGFMQRVEEGSLETYHKPLSEGYIRPTFWLHWVFTADHFANQDRLLLITPNFIDEVSIYYRPIGNPDAEWVRREAGDMTPGIRGDIDYRFPLYLIPASKELHLGYEFVVRIRSTSSIIFEASLWQQKEFIEYAAAQTGYLSFYFGLAAISTFLAVILAFIIRSRLMWAVTGFSSVYILIACIQGYFTWLFPNINFPLQHYLTNFTSLVSYALLIWVSAESLDLKKYLPKLYKAMVLFMLVVIFQVILVPFNQYGIGFEIQGIIYLCVAILFFFSFFYVWHKETYRPLILLLGLSPLVCFLASFLSLAILLGWIDYDRRIYLTWQYAPVFNTFFVTILAVIRSYEEKRLRRDHAQMARELQIEREAGFHQRQFMGMVSHEFRTPLSIISMALQNLYLLPQDNSQITQRYQRIKRATERLVQLTDNCLADSRISAKALYLEKALINWGTLLEEVTSLASLSEQHKLLITFAGRAIQFNELNNYCLEGDKALLQIALSNLLDNAVKHTRQGQIHIDLNFVNSQYILTVEDQGAGIAPELVELIFERYQRKFTSNNESPKKAKGYGLGLYVALQIAKAHKGNLQLTKNSPQGCVFQLSLP